MKNKDSNGTANLTFSKSSFKKLWEVDLKVSKDIKMINRSTFRGKNSSNLDNFLIYPNGAYILFSFSRLFNWIFSLFHAIFLTFAVPMNAYAHYLQFIDITTHIIVSTKNIK